MKNYILNLSQNELQIIINSLVEMPYKISNELINKIINEVKKQESKEVEEIE